MSIELTDIDKRFGDFVAVDNVSLTVQTGELLALLGPSGSGKTTLLRIIAGLEWPDSGSVSFHGEDATSTHARDRQVGFVFQHYALFGHLTIFENIAFGLRVRPRKHRPTEAAIAKKVHTLLELVQLDWLPIGFRTSCPAASGSASRLRVLLRWNRACCCSTSRSARSTRACARTAPVAPAPARRSARHERIRDARPGRGAGSRRPRRRDEPRPCRADGLAGRGLRPSCDAVRVRVPGAREPPAVRGRQRDVHASARVRGVAGAARWRPASALRHGSAIGPVARVEFALDPSAQTVNVELARETYRALALRGGEIAYLTPTRRAAFPA
jgi:ABC-type uncharacterized transport system YnjBCD ATPase subunit